MKYYLATDYAANYPIALLKGDFVKKGTLFWDVDTQYDLMRPEGRLYVPGAEGIIDNVNKARRFALDNGYSMLASTDWHKDGLFYEWAKHRDAFN